MAAIRRGASAVLLSFWAMAGASALAQIKPPPDAPKSWIPERRSAEDGRTAIVDPPLSEAEKRERAQDAAAAEPGSRAEQMMIECLADAAAARDMSAAPNGPGPRKATPEFAEPFTEARNLITSRRYSEALPYLDEAAPHAGDPQQELAVEQLRTAVFAGLDEKEGLILSLEAQLATGALNLATIEAHCQSLLGLRAQLGLLSPDPEPLTTPE